MCIYSRITNAQRILWHHLFMIVAEITSLLAFPFHYWLGLIFITFLLSGKATSSLHVTLFDVYPLSVPEIK